MNYTEGPWRLVSGQVVGGNQNTTCILVNDGDHTESNARLISAAPELYEALKDVHKIICEGAKEGFDPMAGDWADRLFASNAKTHKALSKAEGVTDEE